MRASPDDDTACRIEAIVQCLLEPYVPPRNLVVLRTHFVDQRLLDFSESVEAAPDYDVVVAIDETRGPVDTFGIAKLSMTTEVFDGLGVYTALSDMLWRCGDYPLYLARRHRPDFANYWLIEYDVAINRPDAVGFFQEFDGTHDHDFLSTYFHEREADWRFGDTMQAEYPVVWRAYFPLVRLSGRAIDFLLQRRVLATSKIMAIAPESRPEWPNDEAFVACEMHYNDFECADFNRLGDYYDRRTFRPDVLFHPHLLPAHDGKIYHMVRSGKNYLRTIWPGVNNSERPTLRDILDLTAVDIDFEDALPVIEQQIVARLRTSGDTPAKVLAPDGPILTLLGGNVSARLLRGVVLALAQLRLCFCIDALARIAEQRGWPPIEQFFNVALARPAWQSSVGQWSRHLNCRLDAEGGNDGNDAVDYGFHTDSEPDNHWTVDLQQRHVLTEVRIYNRTVFASRLNGFRLLVSLDGRAWQTAYESPMETGFEGTGSEPIRIALSTPAEFLRVQSRQDGFFHFRELEAYGKAERCQDP